MVTGAARRRRPGACRGLRYRARPLAANMASTFARRDRRQARPAARLSRRTPDRRGAVRRSVRRIRVPSARQAPTRIAGGVWPRPLFRPAALPCLARQGGKRRPRAAPSNLPAAMLEACEIDDPELRLHKLLRYLSDQESGEGWQPRSLAKVAVKTPASRLSGLRALRSPPPLRRFAPPPTGWRCSACCRAPARR